MPGLTVGSVGYLVGPWLNWRRQMTSGFFCTIPTTVLKNKVLQFSTFKVKFRQYYGSNFFIFNKLHS